ncbi:oligosaccharyltransferase complex subunit OSTC-like [Ictidomys tridecemlineatus]
MITPGVVPQPGWAQKHSGCVARAPPGSEARLSLATFLLGSSVLALPLLTPPIRRLCIFCVPFLVLECPNLKLKLPPLCTCRWPWRVCWGVVSCFLITGGIIHDIIVGSNVGSMTDEHRHRRPVAFLAYRGYLMG